MADFEAPSFSLGLDSDSEPPINYVTQHTDTFSSNQFSSAPATLKDKDDDFGTLIVDDSEPEYPDLRAKLKRLRRGITVDATASSSTVELHPRAIVDDEDRRMDEHLHLHTEHPAVCTSSKFLINQPGKSKPNVSNACNSILTSSNEPVYRRRSQLIESDSDSDFDLPQRVGLSNPRKVNESIDLSTTENPSENLKSDKSSLDLDHSLPPSHRYFFHNDLRIQELVRIRLPYFSPLRITSNIDLNQPSTSKIDYMGQFNCGGSSKEAARNNKDNKNSNSRKSSRKSEIEDISDGWVNPKLGVDKRITKRTAKRKGNSVQKTMGHWLTSPNGKKVYVGKKGQELIGRGAYIQYKKESGIGFKKAKRKSATTNKKTKSK